MNQIYKATLSQYALPPSLPIWEDLEVCILETMMFEKYPSISPYTYCANNPMKYVDPDGRKFVVPRVRIEGQKGRYNVTFDGTTATMQQAGRKSSGEVMQYQSGTNQFVDNMIASYNYITNCDGADVDGAMQTMATSSVEIKVKHQRFGGSYLNKTIRFDFSQGERIERDDGVSGYESPAVGFWSEVYHGYLDITGENRSLKSLSDTCNLKEENYVHVTKGNQVIDALNKCYNSNETKRNNYEDAKHEVNMKIVTDTEPIQ